MSNRLPEKLNSQWTHQPLAVRCWGPGSDGDWQHPQMAHRQGNAWAVFRKDEARRRRRLPRPRLCRGSTPAWTWVSGVHSGQAVDGGAGGADIAVNHGFCPCPKMRGFCCSVEPAPNPWFRALQQKQVFLLPPQPGPERVLHGRELSHSSTARLLVMTSWRPGAGSESACTGRRTAGR